MLVPLGTDRPLRRPTLVTYLLIGVSVVVFVAGSVWGALSPDSWARVLASGAWHPSSQGLGGAWSIVSYAFLHAGVLHLAGNCLFLWVFGPNVEDRLGRLWFLVFYLAGGAAAAGLHALFSPAPVIGASGAVAAVTGAYLVLFPRTRVRTLVIFLLIGVFEVPAWVFIAGALAWDFILHGPHRASNVAWAAHVGGYAFGAGVSFGLLALKVIPREVYDLFSIARQAKRRREFAGVVEAGRVRADPPGPARPTPRPRDDARVERVQNARAEVVRLWSTGERDQAAARYAALLREHGSPDDAVRRALALSRTVHLELARHLYESGDFPAAADAFARFAEAHHADPQAPGARLMHGLIALRHLSRPDVARSAIARALEGLHDPGEIELARGLLEQAGSAPTPAG